ncbi:ABC transporter permease [Neorhizobium galegae]|uniref:ABC transporter permease n=1 Tax=Neorhizobium galegae TaxID=399 RepID=UPI000621493A|nr:ABC transporter permease [Neorhizobium galegae]CDZ61689.1 Nickel ABC transporter, permease subunit NikB [Neorhizobium galegae bv. orientalis]KAB1121208.1 ABC transporter permease [Neorhizobium galegae]MCQ1807382.1 ABC transporter permease [Neorhizobium galegae]MCQ1837754.1 ABC transporter permease [Neorhizobium galegae]UIY31500.1 ABC transporter permease [Neorhizobium galegae]
MANFLISRLLYAAVVLLGVSVAVFFLIRIGGDPSALFLPPEAPVEEIQRFRHLMGFDRPLIVQYFEFLGRAVQGDFGMSLRYEQPAMSLVLERVPATLELGGMAFVMSLAVAIPLAILAAANRGSAIDRASLLISLIGQSFPAFWLAIMLILLFSETFHVLPPSGRGGWQHLVMPAIVLATYSTAIITRLLRSSMIEVLQSDYVRTARGKGVRESRIILSHALRNAAIPTLTVIGLQVGALLGGAVITEEVFAYPGIGRLAIQAIANRDFTVVQAFVLFMAVVIVAINLLVDLSYGFLDPRLRRNK